jgi:hypothetical protein
VISREFQSNLKQHAEKWGITTSIRNSALALTPVVALACFGDSVARAAHEAVSLPELDAEAGQWPVHSLYHD